MALLGRLGRRLLPLAVVLCALASLVAARPASAAPASPEPTAYILVNADTGRVIAAKNDHQSLLTASTVKLLTAVTALERLPVDSTVPVSALAASKPAMKINMHEGEVWKLDDALHALLIVSANDAAYAIAERTSGSIEQFAKDAAATAKQLGAQDTVFGDPAGLDDETGYAGGTHMSTYDLAVVARNALAVPEIANTSKTLDYDFKDPTGAGRHLRNHNDGFLTTYSGATGLKTGFTDKAGRTLVTSATRNGHTMIAVVMNTWDDTGWAGYLLDQGFAAPDATGTGVSLPPVRVVTADTRRAAFAGLPPALGLAAVQRTDSSKATAPATTATTKTKTTQTDKPATSSPRSNAQAATTSATAAAGTSSGVTLGTFLNVRVIAIVVVLLILALFLLRRRAVRRQRARRIARQKRMAEIRRRRMIDLLEPTEEPGHVRVVPAESRTNAL
ncbi:MAG: D-alanyl-D-alanine carboxypeptidase family protein [Acidimicrobiia bacterium]